MVQAARLVVSIQHLSEAQIEEPITRHALPGTERVGQQVTLVSLPTWSAPHATAGDVDRATKTSQLVSTRASVINSAPLLEGEELFIM